MRRVVWSAIAAALVLSAAVIAWVVGLVTEARTDALVLAVVGTGLAVLSLRDR